jgi:hypothetical protein
MAMNKKVRFGPLALTTTYTTNLLNPGTTTGGVNMPAGSGNLYFIIRHIRVINKTGTAATFRLFIGATGGNTAGTEFLGIDVSVPANSYVDWYGELTLDVADFLVGGAGTTLALVLEGEGEVGIR